MPTATRRLLRRALVTTIAAVMLGAIGVALPAVASRPDRHDACDTPSPGTSRLAVDVAGVTRTALVHRPSSLGAGRRAPAVITFHGAQLTAEYQAAFDGVDQSADTHGFISIHPQGLLVNLGAGPTLGWDVYNPNTTEPQFVRTLIDALTASQCADPQRVYVIGFSQGGGMAQLAACTVSDRIAAVASVEALPAFPCPNAPAVPVVAFHGLQDLVVPYDTGLPAIGLPSTPATLQAMAIRNHCSPETPEIRHLDANVDRIQWEDCTAATKLYRINQHGHSWPGHSYGLTEAQWAATLTAGVFGLTIQQTAATLALTSSDIDATTVALDFFQNRHLTPHD